MIDHLTEEQVMYLQGFPRKKFHPGECIISQGDNIAHIFFLAQGICVRNFITENGDEVIYEYREADNTAACLLGTLTAYSDEKISKVNFMAKKTCVCHKIPLSVYFEYLSANPDIMHHFLMYVSMKYRNVNENFLARKNRMLANEICRYLLEHTAEEQGILMISPEINNTRIAKKYAANRITIVKIIKQLQEEKIIKKMKLGTAVMDKTALEQYAFGEKKLKYS